MSQEVMSTTNSNEKDLGWYRLPSPDLVQKKDGGDESPLFIQFPSSENFMKEFCNRQQQAMDVVDHKPVYFCFRATNFHRFWQYCVLDEAQIQAERDCYCPQLTMSSVNLVDYIRRCLSGKVPQAKLRTRIVHSKEHKGTIDVLHILVDSSLSGHGAQSFKLPFHWELKCYPVRDEKSNENQASDTKRKHDMVDNDSTASEEQPRKVPRLEASYSNDTEANTSDLLMFQREMQLTNQTIIQPLYSLVRNLYDQMYQLKQQCMKRETVLQKILEVYPGVSQKFGELNSIQNMNHFEQYALHSCRSYQEQEVDLSFSGLQTNLLSGMYSKIVLDMDHSAINKKQASQDNSHSSVETSQSQGIVKREEESQSSTLTSSQVSQKGEEQSPLAECSDPLMDHNGEYPETEQERQRRLEWEKTMEERRQKQQHKKKRILKL